MGSDIPNCTGHTTLRPSTSDSMQRVALLLLLFVVLFAFSPAISRPQVGAAVKESARVLGCQVQNETSVPDLPPNLANPSTTDVEKAVVAWLNEVCTVDDFLDNPGNPNPLVA